MICGQCNRAIKNYDLQQVSLHLDGKCLSNWNLCRHDKIIIHAEDRGKLDDNCGACGCCGNIVQFDSVAVASIGQIAQRAGLAPTICIECSD